MPQDNSIPLQPFAGESPVDNYLQSYYQAKKQKQEDRQALQQDRLGQQTLQLNDLKLAETKHNNLVNILGRSTDEASFQNGLRQATLPVEQGGLGLSPEQVAGLSFAKDYKRLQEEAGVIKERLGNSLLQAQIDASRASTQHSLAATKALRDKPAGGAKPLSSPMQKEFGELGDQYAQVKNSVASFKDEYASRGVMGMGGELVNNKDRLFGGSEAANWWQQYDRYKNVVRNNLFGASLTAGEQAAFEAADITPNMDANTIRKNLLLQKNIIEGSLGRRARAAAASGYNKDSILELTGIGDPTVGSGSGTTAPPPSSGSGNKPAWAQ